MSRQDEVMSEKGVGASTPTLVVPEVEFLTRNDIDFGRWDIHGCEGRLSTNAGGYSQNVRTTL
jgi:hypothetical protein